VSILAAPQHHRDISVSVHPATVWRVGGHLVAIYHFGSHGGPVATAECSCPDKGLCEHLLVALAGTWVCL
jgi:NAD-dependent dihydropyrimidine dehydrogenase PreA subunit